MKTAVVLSGCGHLDGSEIHESVLLLAALDRVGAQACCFAPAGPQRDTVDHASGAAGGASRDMLVEAARIARGKVQPLSAFDATQFDALAFPGGYGAAKNLSDFALRGAQAVVLPEVERAITAVRAAHKPLLALCIAPAVVAAALRGSRVRLTVGEDAGAAAALEAMGAVHVPCKVHECCVDERLRVVSAPAYMHDASIAEVARGIDAAVAELARLVRTPVKPA